MQFKEFKNAVKSRVARMVNEGRNLYEVEINKDELWETYLNAFPAGTNEVFRERREHDCSCCRHFVKSFGNVVEITDGVTRTIWELVALEEPYKTVAKQMDHYVLSRPISNFYLSKESRIGTESNNEIHEDGTVIKWEHFSVLLPANYVSKNNETIDTVKGRMRDAKNVFQRSLEELTKDSILTVLDLVAQNSIYRGEEWEGALKKFLELHVTYSKIEQQIQKDNFCWEYSHVVGAVSKIRNSSMGTLLIDISAWVDLDEAVRKYESIVAPENYKRPKAIYTQRMLEEAKKKLEDDGLLDTIHRRYAIAEDIAVSNVLYMNHDAAPRLNKTDAFDEMSQGIGLNPKSFSKVEEVGIDDFIKNIIPTVTSMEVLVENRHANNMVSLIAPKVKNCSSLFKWKNGYSWAYSGNLADSMKARVKAAGGNIEGCLRFSIQWNTDEFNPNDFDAHCHEPNGRHIYFGNKRLLSSGSLDVDIINPVKGQPAVENIVYTHKNKMLPGQYSFAVHCYNNRGGRDGFSAEIEIDGQLYSFDYNKELKHNETVYVAKVILNADGTFTIVEKIPSAMTSKSIWGIQSNKFHPVSMIMNSPNHWDQEDGSGNKHVFFFLNGCTNPENPNGFFNEYLREEYMKHKRVFEALGSKMRVDDDGKQLSGVGFSSTKRDSIVCKIDGRVERTVKIIF